MTTPEKKPKRVYRITYNGDDRRLPFALLDETDTVVRVSASTHFLTELAFDLWADEVRHDYLQVRS